MSERSPASGSGSRPAAGSGSRLAAVVLAAGAGSRFSDRPGAKLLADLDGRPVLAHVLDAVRAFGPERTVVVLGHGRSEIEAAICWRTELRVVNPHPDRGLSSSLRTGFAALKGLLDPLEGAFIVLGDQPLLQADVMRALAAAARTSDERGAPAAVVPRYGDRLGGPNPGGGMAGDRGPGNPLLLMRPAWAVVEGLEGDRGIGAILRSMPGRVLEVHVAGGQPDVDTPEDLAAIVRAGPSAGGA